MAAVPTVGGTPIDGSNAYKYYLDYCNGNNKYHLTEEQANRCKVFLSPEEIQYCQTDREEALGDAKQAGKDKIDTEGMGDGKGRGDTDSDNKTMTNIGIANSCVTAAAILIAIAVDGFSQWAIAAIVIAGAAINLASALMMDGAYDKREQQNQKNEQNITEIVNQASQVENAIAQLKEDRAEYDMAQQEKTDILCEAANENATLQMDLHDAEALGDTNEANAIREQLEANEEDADTSGCDERMTYFRERIDEARYINEEAGGAKESAITVSDFLKEGDIFVNPAKFQQYANTGLAGACALVVACAVPKLPFFADAPSSLIAKVIYGAAGAIFGSAASTFGTKATNEETFKTSGDNLGKECGTLGQSIANLAQEISTTESAYDQSDNCAQQNRQETQEAADASVEQNNGSEEPGQPTQPPGDQGGGGDNGDDIAEDDRRHLTLA